MNNGLKKETKKKAGLYSSIFSIVLLDRFFFKKINWSTCSGDNTLRSERTMSPAVLNTRSAGTLVLGMHK